MTTRLQVLVDSKLKNKAETVFADYGLNINEGVRMLITSFVNGKISLEMSTQVEFVKLSDKAKARYKDIMDDIINHRNVFPLDDNIPLATQIEQLDRDIRIPQNFSKKLQKQGKRKPQARG